MDKQSVTSREEDLMRDRLVKVPELLKLLGMSRPTLEKMIESGRFPKPMSDIYHGARLKGSGKSPRSGNFWIRVHKTNVEPINENSSLEARVYWADHMTVQLQLTTTESAYLHHVAACSIPNKSACTHSQGSIVAMSGYQHRRTIASAQKTLAKIGVVKIDDGQGNVEGQKPTSRCNSNGETRRLGEREYR